MYLFGTATSYIIFPPRKVSVGCGPGACHPEFSRILLLFRENPPIIVRGHCFTC